MSDAAVRVVPELTGESRAYATTRTLHGGVGANVKRTFDVALSCLGLVGSLPLWAIIAAAIKLDDGGKVFYHQARIGLAGDRKSVV